MFDVFSLILAFGGGFFAAAIGGLHGFIFTGFMVLAGHAIMLAGGSSDFLSYVAFGPVFGPHISFAGGVAAVAYAAHTARNKDVGGKDIGVPLIQLERPDVLAVGGVFGMFGYVLQFLISKIPVFGGLVDSVALTVLLSAFVVRLVFGRSSIFGHLPEGAGWGRFSPRDDAAWVRWHERFVPNTVLGLGAGLLAAGTVVKLAQLYPQWAQNGPAYTLWFGVSAMSLFFLSLGLQLPRDPPHDDHCSAGRAEVPTRGRPHRRGTDRYHRRHGLGLGRRAVRPALARPRQHPHRPSGRRHLDHDLDRQRAGPPGRHRLTIAASFRATKVASGTPDVPEGHLRCVRT